MHFKASIFTFRSCLMILAVLIINKNSCKGIGNSVCVRERLPEKNNCYAIIDSKAKNSCIETKLTFDPDSVHSRVGCGSPDAACQSEDRIQTGVISPRP